MDRATALQLVVVSKAVFEWIDPIIYRVVVFASVDSTKSFWTAIQTRGPESFARNVKTLVFDGHWWPPDSTILRLIFSACTGVTSLTWWIFYEDVPLYARPDTPSLFPTHLYLFEKYPFAMTCIPCSVTHISLSTEYMARLRTDTLAQIVARCPSLTHICVSDCLPLVFDIYKNGFSEYVNDLLDLVPPTVKVFAMRLTLNRYAEQIQQKRLQDSLAMIKDPRFVPIRTNQFWYQYSLTGIKRHTSLESELNVGANWGSNANADLDIWEFAEQYLRSKAKI
ncbi:hypothetical protein BDZ89DRAFT_1078515, partial [Hymenopellis radicata]